MTATSSRRARRPARCRSAVRMVWASCSRRRQCRNRPSPRRPLAGPREVTLLARVKCEFQLSKPNNHTALYTLRTTTPPQQRRAPLQLISLSAPTSLSLIHECPGSTVPFTNDPGRSHDSCPSRPPPRPATLSRSCMGKPPRSTPLTLETHLLPSISRLIESRLD